MADRLIQPRLGQILRYMAADESRHAVAFASFGRRYLEAEPTALRPVLEMAYFWLSDPSATRHPADHFYPGAAVEFRIDKVPVARAVLSRADRKIFGYLSEMTGLDLQSPRDLKRALVKRTQLFTDNEERSHIRGHDLRATFVTVHLAVGKTETWVADRTGHKSSAMIARYRRLARSQADLDEGELTPLVDALPELALATPVQGTRTPN